MAFNLLNLLLPREDKFYDYLSQQVANLQKGCVQFKECLEVTTDEDRKRYYASIKECERVGDEIEIKILDELSDAFITPLDREDIHDIATDVDTALDILNGTSRKLEMYVIVDIPQNVKKFARIIVAIVSELVTLIKGLKAKSSVNESINKMHRLENEADELFHQCMVDLFKDGNSAVEIIKMKEIYERLESAVDSVDRIGKMIRGIMVKMG
jgi:uncharacterized protein Yka (UPF0111/DUF47 family)